MTMERVLHMKGGVGETSYVNNSFLQRNVVKKVKNILEENIKLTVSNTFLNGCIKVADLGCSSGPNALMAMSNILNIIAKTSLALNHGSLVFQIYLSDLFENDFNTIFKLLPDFNKSIQQECGDNVEACFINATPGNFYGRLFPSNSINFFHSSYSIHWLSQAPKSLTEKTEPLNKGNIYITRRSPQSVYDAYRKQFERDFKYFLESRFEELACGGVMVLTLIGRETTEEINCFYEGFNTILIQMVQEGLIEEAQLDLFDIPIYHPTIEEVRHLIKSEGSFTLQTLETFKTSYADLQEDSSDDVPEGKIIGEFLAKTFRAIFEPLLLADRFGENMMDEIFLRFAKLAAKLVELDSTHESTNIVLIMTKDS